MDDMRDHEIAAIAARQHGVFTLTHARAVGFTADQRKRRLVTGRWQARYPGVYVMAGVPETWRSRVLAACWSTPGLAAGSHRTGAELWALPGGATDPIEITCDRHRRAKSVGLVVHETEVLRTEDVTSIDGIPVVSVEQTLLGLSAILRPERVEIALDRALQRGLTTHRALDDFVEAKRGRGRNGVGVLRGLVRNLDPLAGKTESAMETMLKQLLRRRGFPLPQFQYEIWHGGCFVARVDAAYPEHRIAIEYDSYEHHTGKLAIVRDNDRRNRLRRIQWRTVVFTAADIKADGGQAIEALRAELSFGAGRRR